MKLHFAFFALLCCTATTLFAQQQPAKIVATGVGTVTAFPNAAQITLYLEFLKPTLKEAITENKSATKGVLAVVKKFAQDTTGIKVSLISTDKEMRYSAAQKKEVFVGFESNQRIIFTLNNLDAMQDFTEAIMKTRIYEIQRVSYFHTEGAGFIKQAQENAVADAAETTKRLAKAAGVTLGSIVLLSTDSSPEEGATTRSNSYRIQTYSKQLEVANGVTSSGELLTFTANVRMETEIRR
jgi:uncharacterized protein YggE